MRLNIVQASSLIMLFTLMAVPSLAFPSRNDSSCYQSPLLYEGTEYGKIKLMSDNGHSKLEVEVEQFLHHGIYSVQVFKDYYSDILLGDIEINDEGNGKAEFEIIYSSPDFVVQIVNEGYVLTSDEWIMCEKATKPDNINVCPRVLNLKNNGKWVTVNIIYPLKDLEPTDFKMHIGVQTLAPEVINVGHDHVLLKFNSNELEQYCNEGVEIVKISFKVGEYVVELSDTIKIINNGNKNLEQTQNNQIITKSNDAKNKNK